MYICAHHDQNLEDRHRQDLLAEKKGMAPPETLKIRAASLCAFSKKNNMSQTEAICSLSVAASEIVFFFFNLI
jgi:hypothetical protein